MKKYYYIFIFIFVFYVGFVIVREQNHMQNYNKLAGAYEFASESANLPYGTLDGVKLKFENSVAKYKPSQDKLGVLDTNQLMNGEKLKERIDNFNQNIVPKLTRDHDAIDAFIASLPASYRRHFTLVHRSFSIQKGTPTSPRVILYGPDAKLIITFNGGVDTDGSRQEGGNSIEVIEWNTKELTWDFSEITLNIENNLVQTHNPAKCVMCHAGTPKPVYYRTTGHYTKYLKPIFPQYPFWPGFYGSVNDIVAINDSKSKDSIMRSETATLKQIEALTFAHTEELHRLRTLFDTNPNYKQIVINEMKTHLTYFQPFMDNIKNRNRYRHLITLKDLYKQNEIPEVLKSAPFRRTFDKEYGHYLLRPNFYLSSLLTFYQAQAIAKQILEFPLFDQFKYSLLARKYNCGEVIVKHPHRNLQINIKDLDPSFDLVYPNQASQESRDRQYLLAYQYNVVASQKGGKAHLPLHAWNLEANEEIASYHYGNVFSDLNEIVLWNLATHLFSDLKAAKTKSAAEERHYLLPNSQYFKFFLDGAKGFVTRMNQKSYDFANSMQNYYDTNTIFNAQPASMYCEKYFIPKAKEELAKFFDDSTSNQSSDKVSRTIKKLPHSEYLLSDMLYTHNDISNQLEPNTNLVRQACEACHSNKVKSEEHVIKPRINVDWYSDTYHTDLHQEIIKINDPFKQKAELAYFIQQSISENTLPVPFENRMPFARRPMDKFSTQCELLIVKNSYHSSYPLKANAYNCTPENPQSIDCKCAKLMKQKEEIYKQFHPK